MINVIICNKSKYPVSFIPIIIISITSINSDAKHGDDGDGGQCNMIFCVCIIHCINILNCWCWSRRNCDPQTLPENSNFVCCAIANEVNSHYIKKDQTVINNIFTLTITSYCNIASSIWISNPLDINIPYGSLW